MLVSTFLNKPLQNTESTVLAAVEEAAMSGWDERDFTLGRPHWNGSSDIWHTTVSSAVAGRASWTHIHLALVFLLAKEVL